MDEKIKQEEIIKEIINKLRPFLINDGGNIEFVKYEDNIVYIRMMGACANCQMLDLTLNEGIAIDKVFIVIIITRAIIFTWLKQNQR